jgi:hypothetical protein
MNRASVFGNESVSDRKYTGHFRGRRLFLEEAQRAGAFREHFGVAGRALVLKDYHRVKRV